MGWVWVGVAACGEREHGMAWHGTLPCRAFQAPLYLTAMALMAMSVVAMVVMALAHTVHTARRKGEGRSSSMQDATTDAALAHVSKHHVRPVECNRWQDACCMLPA